MYRKRTSTLCRVLYTKILILCFAFGAFAQSNSFIPFSDDSLALTTLLTATTLRFESDKAAANGDNRKYIIEQYQERYDQLKKMYSEKEFVTDPKATAYLKSLLDLIVSKNTVLQPLKPTALFSKVYWPNAASFGEGTLVFNISLFNRLQNEAEAAFILCHELSHLYLDHGNKAIMKYVNTLYSKEMQAELRDIKKAEYLQGQRLKGLAKDFAFNSRRHSRDHELEADSMALEFLKNTGFDVRESLNALNMLDSVDNEKYARQLRLNEQMNFDSYPFQPRWIRPKSISLGEAMSMGGETSKTDEEFNKDSLKTHPDCSARMLRLKTRVDQVYNASQKTFLINQPYFDTLINRFDRERIAYCYQQQHISRALFYSLQMFSTHASEPWLATTIGKCFNALYNAQQGHYLGKLMDLPSSGKEKTEYDIFLQYLQSLRLDEMAAESYWFMEQQRPHFTDNTAFMNEYKNSQKTYTTASKN